MRNKPVLPRKIVKAWRTATPFLALAGHAHPVAGKGAGGYCLALVETRARYVEQFHVLR